MKLLSVSSGKKEAKRKKLVNVRGEGGPLLKALKE
jgi:hypothetical protein